MNMLWGTDRRLDVDRLRHTLWTYTWLDSGPAHLATGKKLHLYLLEVALKLAGLYRQIAGGAVHESEEDHSTAAPLREVSTK